MACLDVAAGQVACAIATDSVLAPKRHPKEWEPFFYPGKPALGFSLNGSAAPVLMGPNELFLVGWEPLFCPVKPAGLLVGWLWTRMEEQLKVNEEPTTRRHECAQACGFACIMFAWLVYFMACSTGLYWMWTTPHIGRSMMIACVLVLILVGAVVACISCGIVAEARDGAGREI